MNRNNLALLLGNDSVSEKKASKAVLLSVLKLLH